MILKTPTLACAAIAAFLASSPAYAGEPQVTTSTTSDDVAEILDRPGVAGIGLIKPGVFVDFTQSDTMDFEDGTDGLDLINVRTRLPLIGKRIGENIFSLSLRYEFTEFETDFLGPRDLNKFRLGLQMVHEPKDTGLLGFIRFEPGLAFESGAASSDGFDLTSIGILGYKLSDRFSAAIGYYANWGFDEFAFYPAAGFIWQPAHTLHFQVTPPIINIAWSPNSKWLFFINTYPAGGTWLLDGDQRSREIDLQLFRASVGAEYSVTKNLKVAVRGGINFLTNLEVRDENHVVVAEEDLDSALFYAVTLTYAF